LIFSRNIGDRVTLPKGLVAMTAWARAQVRTESDPTMPAPLTPEGLKDAVAGGMLAFPLTDFDAAGDFDVSSFVARLEWLSGYKPAAFFMAGGAGEFFSLTPREFAAVIAAGVESCGGKLPVIASAGYGTRTAIEYAQESERLGADGILLLPPYLTEGSQEGLRAHISAVCRATRLGVIVYNRANCRLAADTVARLAADCPNLIGFKDGVGDIEQLAGVRNALGSRLVFLNGMPTAETYARSYRGMGVPVYSSAVFNFIPRTALAFHRALNGGDEAAIDRLLRDFFVPYVRIRNRGQGYAVSIVKAGAAIVGRGAGKVRPPLSDCTAEEIAELRALIERMGPQD
jgi:5-dehydro-4-deoxyglucarate dehydratase